ncbi:MAG: SPFH domain-containing protein [Anaerolineae bacterium]
MRSLERVNGLPALSAWWQTAVPFIPLPPQLIPIFEMFHFRVLRHLIIPALGWYLAYRAAVSLVQTLYDLPDRAAAQQLLSRFQSRGTSQAKPIPVNRKVLEEKRAQSALLQVGGPGRIAVKAGDVVVTELNGRFHRILGPGGHMLRRLEYVHSVLDLRPQERHASDVRLTTRDGIDVNMDITVNFRLDTGGEFPSKERPYPYNEEAVRLAAYNQTVLPDGTISTWDNAPLNNAKSNLTKIIATYKLDALLYTRAADDPLSDIRNELIHKIRPLLFNQGIELTGLHLSRLELPQEVSDQYIQYWQAHWDTQIQLKKTEGDAAYLEEVEVAQAEAEMTMIQAIIKGVQRARSTSSTNNMNEIIALRLVEALEKMARESQEIMPLPDSLMSQLGEMRHQLTAGDVLPPEFGQPSEDQS